MTLITKKLSKLDDGRYGPKMYFSIANKHHHLSIYSELCF